MATLLYSQILTGATSGVAGKAGAVPAPAAGSQDLVLHGNGSFLTVIPNWVASTNYSAGAVTFTSSAVWRRNSAGTSGATFDGTEEAQWTKLAEIGGGSADNLGNHTATQALTMAGFDIDNAGDVEADSFTVIGNTNNWTASPDGSDTLDFTYNATTAFSISTGGNLTLLGTLDGRDVATDGGNLDALVTLTGVAAGSTNLGTFSGSTISDSQDVKAALQELETFVEGLSGGLVPQGTWNATTNTPDLTAGGNQVEGHYYRVSVAGSTNLDGITDWEIGDHLFYANSAWQKIDNTDQFVNLSFSRDATTVTVINDLGTNAVLPAATTSLAGVMSATDKTNLDSLVTLSGVAGGSTDLGTFTGATFTDNQTIKQILQESETQLEFLEGAIQSTQTANFTAASGNIYPIDVSGGAITVSPPGSPSADDWFGLHDLGSASTNNITVDFTTPTQPLNNAADDFSINADNGVVYFRYVNGTVGWIFRKG